MVRALVGVGLSLVLIAGCESSDNTGATGGDAGPNVGIDGGGGGNDGGGSDPDGGSLGTGDIDCGAGKKKTSAGAATGGVPIAGFWHVTAYRDISGVEDPDVECDDEIAFALVAPTYVPGAALDDAAKNAAECALANEKFLRVIGGRVTLTHTTGPTCQGTDGCSAGSPLGDRRLLWDSTANSGSVFEFVNDKPSGMSVGRFALELPSGKFVHTFGTSAGYLLGQSNVAPACTGP